MPNYKLLRGTFTDKDKKVHQQGDTVEIDEATAKEHPDIFEVAGEDSRLYPDDGTPKDKVDDKTKKARAEAIRREAATMPTPPPDEKTKPTEGTAQAIQTEQQRAAEAEKRSLFGRRGKEHGHSGEGGG